MGTPTGAGPKPIARGLLGKLELFRPPATHKLVVKDRLTHLLAAARDGVHLDKYIGQTVDVWGKIQPGAGRGLVLIRVERVEVVGPKKPAARPAVGAP